MTKKLQNFVCVICTTIGVEKKYGFIDKNETKRKFEMEARSENLKQKLAKRKFETEARNAMKIVNMYYSISEKANRKETAKSKKKLCREIFVQI